MTEPVDPSALAACAGAVLCAVAWVAVCWRRTGRWLSALATALYAARGVRRPSKYGHWPRRARTQRRRLGPWVVSLPVILAGCGSARLPRTAQGPEGSWRTFANGLRFFVAPDSSGDVVQVHMRVRAGSRNETRAQGGLAHFSEHLAFARTMPDGRTMLAALGQEALDYQGTTDYDSVDFKATTVAAHLPTVLGLFASALDGSCEVRPEVFTRERNVVLSEIEYLMPGTVTAYDELQALVYSPDHPYGHLPSGTPETVSALTAEDACDFLRGRFTPGNASVVITGRVSEADALAAAEATLKPLASRAALPEVVVPPVAGTGGRKKLAGLPGGRGTALVFHLPPASSEDGHLAAILVQAVAETGGAAEQLSSLELHYIGGSAAPAAVLVARGLVEEEVLQAAVAGVREAVGEKKTVESLRPQLRIEAATRYEHLDARAERLVEVADGSRHGALATDLRAIDGLTPAALTRLAEQVLALDQVEVLELEPGPTRAGTGLAAVTRLADDARPATAEPDVAARLLREIPATSRSSRYTLANGLTVVLAPSSSPLVDVRLVIAAGGADAPPEHPLLAVMAAQMLEPPKKSAHARAYAKMTARGAKTEVRLTHETTVFKARGLANETHHLLRGLAAEVLAGEYDFAARAAKVELLYDDMVGRLRAEPVRRGVARLSLDRCEADPLRYEGDLDDISDAAITAFREQHYRAGRTTLIVAGGFDEAVARAHVQAAFGGRAPWGAPATAPARPGRPDPAVRPEVVRVWKNQAQVTVFLGLVVPSELRRDEGTLSLARQLIEDAIQAVRERLGISYGFSVTREELCGAELLVIVGDIDAAHVEQGVAELRQALARLRTREGIVAGLAAARRPVAARLLAEASDSSKIADRLTYLVRHDLPLDYYRSEAREVAEARADAVADLMARLLAPDRLFKVCTGPEERTEACEALNSP
ncbi:M16 family metallopeptidase [Nannocystis punicea]|uniref:Insulinase family protein n=1 Tax=Nannocystis punicea TaxID=2995304 RepID=A0ABY7HAH9_9BACT|nr:M16 family metallopeptidase [Nannocystis poenicansa]WAS96049.1 insulinase family protein [Nannocystis poenicansa]